MRVAVELGYCAVSGCNNREVRAVDKTRAGVCQRHMHTSKCTCYQCRQAKKCIVCGGRVFRMSVTRMCKSCMNARGGAVKALQGGHERHTVAGLVRGCRTTVTADTEEQARSLLAAMGGTRLRHRDNAQRGAK